VNVTRIWQEEPAGRELVQALVSAKTPGLLPPRVTLDRVSGALPVFDSVSGIAVAVAPTLVAGNEAVDVRVAMGAAAATPVPLSAAVCIPTESVTVNVSLCPPVAEGVKTTV
jgi:hypothetical protein